MRGLVRRVSTGQRGFTLIELLVVVAILGIIAAVVVLNIGGFLGTGAVQAANTELHQVQTAVIAALADGQTVDVGSEIGPDADAGHPAEDYLLNPEGLQATYTVGTGGKITNGVVDSDGQWAGRVTWSNGQWE